MSKGWYSGMISLSFEMDTSATLNQGRLNKLLDLLAEPIAESDLKIKSERDYRTNTFTDLLLAGWNLFEAGFVVAEGNIVFAADFCEALDLLLRKVFPAEDDFGDGILRKDAVQRIKVPEDRETDDSLSLIPRILIDEPYGAKVQPRIADEFFDSIHPPLAGPINQDSSSFVILCEEKLFKDSKGAPRTNDEDEEEIEIDQEHRPA